jgi:hypothetical protein
MSFGRRGKGMPQASERTPRHSQEAMPALRVYDDAIGFLRGADSDEATYTYCIYRRNLRGGMHLRVR